MANHAPGLSFNQVSAARQAFRRAFKCAIGQLASPGTDKWTPPDGKCDDHRQNKNDRENGYGQNFPQTFHENTSLRLNCRELEQCSCREKDASVIANEMFY